MKHIALTGQGGEPIELDADCVLANDVTFPGEFNPHHVTIYVIRGINGPMAAVWGPNTEDALDTAADEDLLEGIEVEEEEDDTEETRGHHLGSYTGMYDLTYVVVERLIVKDQPLATLLRFAEARGGGHQNLDF